LKDLVFISTNSDVQTYNIRRVSAYLKNHGFTVKIIFLPHPMEKMYSEKILNQLVELCKDARLIGVTLMSNFWKQAVQIINTMKKHYPDTPIIGGGSHPTVNGEECLEQVDMICVGEGDDTLLELLTKIKNNDTDYKGIPNLHYKQNGEIIRNQLAKFEKTDQIPIPDYDFEDHHVLFEGKIQPMTYNLLRAFYGEMYSTQFTFGCPFVCSFCIHSLINKRFTFKFRKRSIDSIIAELSYIKKKLPFIESLRIDDDTFFYYTKEELEHFRDEYKKHVGLPIYVTGGQPMVMKTELMKPMVEAGMDRIRMGIQTAAYRSKKLYDRTYPNDKILEACKVINSFKGVWVTYDFIVDNPWETEEETVETLKFILEIPQPFVLSVFSLTFFPGTKIYEKALEDGIIKDSEDALNKGYSGLANTYLNALFMIYADAWIPKKFKLFLLKDSVRKSRYAPMIQRTLKGYVWLKNKKSLAKFLFNYVRKLDTYRVVFSIKKYFYDRRAYNSYIK